jgi:hypothetical protein
VVRRLVPFGIPLLFVGGLLGAVTACAKDNKAIDKGGECFFANECAPGLVCVADKDTGKRICTDDLSEVAGEPPGMGEEGDAADEGGEGGTTDGPVIPDTGTDQSTTDTGIDTGVDTGVPTDSGTD